MKKGLLLIPITLISLSACQSYEYDKNDMSDYILTMDYKDDFKILQLTDLHLANKDDRNRQYNYLDSIITADDPDLIIVTGDLFTFGDKIVAQELFNFLDSYGCKWTLTFGNHDEQCYFSVDWLTDYLNNYGSNCLFKNIHGDNVYGDANFAINLMSNNKIQEQLIIMDSNRYCYGDYIGYDYIKENQIQWYSDLVDYTTKQNSNEAVQSFLFFHIPLPEWVDAWEAYQNNSPDVEFIIGQKGEDNFVPNYNSGFFDVILEKQSTKGIFVGHDHLNDYTLKYKGIYLSYGVTSTDRIYYDEDIIGGQVITIHNDHSIDIEHIIRSYEQVK